jgi:hypothetical protein
VEPDIILFHFALRRKADSTETRLNAIAFKTTKLKTVIPAQAGIQVRRIMLAHAWGHGNASKIGFRPSPE